MIVLTDDHHVHVDLIENATFFLYFFLLFFFCFILYFLLFSFLSKIFIKRKRKIWFYYRRSRLEMYVSKLYSSCTFIVRAQRVHILNRYITNVKHNFSVCVRILTIIVTIRLSQFNFLQVLISYFEKKTFFCFSSMVEARRRRRRGRSEERRVGKECSS